MNLLNHHHLLRTTILNSKSDVSVNLNKLGFYNGGVQYQLQHLSVYIISVLLFKLLLIFVILALAGYVLQNLSNVSISGWPLGELLINYEGGFVRRGLFGQIIFGSENPIITVSLIQKKLILVFYVGCGLLLLLWEKPFSALSAFVLVTFAPGGLFDMASSSSYEYLDRKEIWFYVAGIIMILYAKLFGVFRISSALFFSIISCAMILHHELFFLYFSVPISVILVFAALVTYNRQIVISALLYVLITTIVFIIVILHPGTTDTVNGILSSYQGTDASRIRGGIEAIGWDLEKSHQLSVRMLTQGSVMYWVFFLSMAILLAINTVVVASRNYFTLFISYFVIVWLLFAIFLSAWLGWDWGRWISMYSISLFLMMSMLQVTDIECFETSWLAEKLKSAAGHFIRHSYNTNIISFALVSFAVLTGILTRMNHCCPQHPAIIFDDKLFNRLFHLVMNYF